MKIIEDTRKLTVSGGKTYCITLPLAMVRELGWRKGQKKTIRIKDRSIVISDWENT
jgi:antitoxin component of MazEF toxin-antitoxin module